MSDWIVRESAQLTLAEQQNNARIIGQAFSAEGWTLKAICAMLGNMQLESSVNPGRWQNDTIGSGGFGLVQWTPASTVRNWIQSYYGSTDYTNGDFQLGRILYELDNGLQYYPTNAFPLTFREFTQSEADLDYLTDAWLYNYERGTPYLEQRRKNARYWWYFFGGGPLPEELPVWLTAILTKRKRKKGIILV